MPDFPIPLLGGARIVEDWRTDRDPADREDRFADLAQAPGQWEDEILHLGLTTLSTRRRRRDGGLR